MLNVHKIREEVIEDYVYDSVEDQIRHRNEMIARGYKWSGQQNTSSADIKYLYNQNIPTNDYVLFGRFSKVKFRRRW